MRGPALDPAPHEDLQSDIAFKLWLTVLDPAVVERDREANQNIHEQRWTAVARKDSENRPVIGHERGDTE